MKTSNQDIVHLSFCRIVFVYVFLRQERVFRPTSFNNLSVKTRLVAPLTIRAASCCIFSSSFASYCVQLSHTTSAYSSNGLINEKYM